MDILAVLIVLIYTIYAAWHGDTVSAATWNAEEMKAAVWVLLAIFFLWLLHGIDDIRKPVDVFIAIVVVAVAMMQYQNVGKELSGAWSQLGSGSAAPPASGGNTENAGP